MLLILQFSFCLDLVLDLIIKGDSLREITEIMFPSFQKSYYLGLVLGLID
jgi:hypothetical protein